MMAGYIKIHRGMLEWGWYSDANTMRVFMDILLNTNYEDREYLGYTIKKGQCVIGRKKLAQRLGISERSVRTALEHLKMTKEITIKTTNKFSIVTVENWDKYQAREDVDDQQPTSNRPTTDQQPTTSKKERKKEGKNNIFIPPTVDEVRAYCKERKNNINAEEFCDFYSSKGWMVGKNKMKDWKASVRTWERNNKSEPKGRSGAYIPEPPKYKQFEPEPEVEGTQMPEEIRQRLRGMFG